MTGTNRLGAADSWFLYLEGPTQHLHVTGLVLLDPSSSIEPVDFARFRSHLVARFDHLPALRKRVIAVPMGINHPTAVDDPDLDIDDHLEHVSMAGEPEEAFRQYLDDYCSVSLDRSRPLWHMAWVDDLTDGRCALVVKLHHTMVDGMTGVGIMADLLDLSADEPAERPDPVDPPPTNPAALPTHTETILDAAADRISDPLRPARALMRTGSSLLRAADALVTGRGSGEDHAAPFGTPRTRLNASLTERRSVAFGTTPLQGVKDLRRAYGTTVNDVVLTACAVGLRKFLAEHDEIPDRPLVASVPVSVHTQDSDDGAATNQVSNMFVHLPVHLEDPVERLRAVQRSASGAKHVQGAIGPEMLGDMVDLIPPPMLSAAMSAFSRAGLADRTPPAHSLIVSNVPGPDFPLYMAGAEVVGLYPFGPLMEGSGLNVTVISHNGRLDIGLIACPDLVPGLEELLGDILGAFDELEALADKTD